MAGCVWQSKVFNSLVRKQNEEKEEVEPHNLLKACVPVMKKNHEGLASGRSTDYPSTTTLGTSPSHRIF